MAVLEMAVVKLNTQDLWNFQARTRPTIHKTKRRHIPTETMSKSVLLSILMICVLGTSSSFGQQKKKVEHVKGEWVVSNDITPMQARENAINQAKIEALRLAGVPEFISESNLQYHSEKPEIMKELFESLATVSISGEVSEFRIVKEVKELNEYGNIVYDVWIDAMVVIHQSAKDQGFNMEVRGVREGYSSPDQLTFEVTPWKEGYLTAFILGETESSQLYPNNSERQEKLTALTAYSFPRSKAVEYEVSTENPLEINYLILLYSKQEIPFMKEPTHQNILKFIAGIDPAQKSLKTYSFLIKK